MKNDVDVKGLDDRGEFGRRRASVPPSPPPPLLDWDAGYGCGDRPFNVVTPIPDKVVVGAQWMSAVVGSSARPTVGFTGREMDAFDQGANR